MTTQISRAGAWSRCALATTPALIAFLLGDATFRALVSPQLLVWLGALAVVCSNIRNWLDQSHGQSKQDQPEVPAVASPPPSTNESPDEDRAN